MTQKERLEVLKEVQGWFLLHSDHSTRTNGYRSLCTFIESAEKELEQKVDNVSWLDKGKPHSEEFKLRNLLYEEKMKEAIAFGEYLRINGWEGQGNNDELWRQDAVIGYYEKTTEELYQEFVKTRQG